MFDMEGWLKLSFWKSQVVVVFDFYGKKDNDKYRGVFFIFKGEEELRKKNNIFMFMSFQLKLVLGYYRVFMINVEECIIFYSYREDMVEDQNKNLNV